MLLEMKPFSVNTNCLRSKLTCLFSFYTLGNTYLEWPNTKLNCQLIIEYIFAFEPIYLHDALVSGFIVMRPSFGLIPRCAHDKATKENPDVFFLNLFHRKHYTATKENLKISSAQHIHSHS